MSETNSDPSGEQTADLTPRANAAVPLPVDATGQALGERLGVGDMAGVYRFSDQALQIVPVHQLRQFADGRHALPQPFLGAPVRSKKELKRGGSCTRSGTTVLGKLNR